MRQLKRRSPRRLVRTLADLKLSASHRAALAVQGSVARELRAGNAVFKLRFRADGRQSARYLTTDPRVAATIAAELSRLQAKRRFESAAAAASRRGGPSGQAKNSCSNQRPTPAIAFTAAPRRRRNPILGILV